MARPGNGSIPQWESVRTSFAVHIPSISNHGWNQESNQIMFDVLEDHVDQIPLRVWDPRNITKFRFADDIIELSGTEDEVIEQIIVYIDRDSTNCG